MMMRTVSVTRNCSTYRSDGPENMGLKFNELVNGGLTTVRS